MSQDSRSRYDAWMKRLKENDAVVAYVYDSPDGFYYVPREPIDGDGVIRRPTG